MWPYFKTGELPKHTQWRVTLHTFEDLHMKNISKRKPNFMTLTATSFHHAMSNCQAFALFTVDDGSCPKSVTVSFHSFLFSWFGGTKSLWNTACDVSAAVHLLDDRLMDEWMNEWMNVELRCNGILRKQLVVHAVREESIPVSLCESWCSLRPEFGARSGHKGFVVGRSGSGIGFFTGYFVFPYQYHTTNAPYSFIHRRRHILFEGVVT